MAKFNIGDDFRVVSDSRQWIAEQRRVAGEDAKVPGEVTWISVSYHATAEQACHSLGERMLRQSDAECLREMLAAQQRIHQLIEESFRVPAGMMGKR